MLEKPVILTRLGHTHLRAQADELRAKRAATIDEISAARELGDLRENGDYHAAREAAAWIEARLKDIEDTLRRAEIVDPVNQGEIDYGLPFMLRNEDTGDQRRYVIVDTAELPFTPGGLSSESPLAEAVLWLREGEQGEVYTEHGVTLYTVVAIGH